MGLILLLAVVAGLGYKSLKIATKTLAIAFISSMFPLVANTLAGFTAIPVTPDSMLYYALCGGGLFLAYSFADTFYGASQVLGQIIMTPLMALYDVVESFLKMFESDEEKTSREDDEK